MGIVLYSTHCPRCDVLEKKLKQKDIEFTINTDFDPLFLKEKGFDFLPVLQVEDEFMDYKEAINWMNGQDV